MLRCDIFCRVIDNFGDAGVAWRLARSLQREECFCVRLIIDKLDTLKKLNPKVDLEKSVQTVNSVEIALWDNVFEETAEPADCVIEAFSCFLPAQYEEKIDKRFKAGKPVGVLALDYLTAESYAADFHGLPSPHPKYGYPKRFFFPGFTPKTGGLFIEADFEKRRALFTKEKKEEFLKDLGVNPEHPLKVLLFTYPSLDIKEIAKAFASTDLDIEMLLCPGAAQECFAKTIDEIGAKNIHCVMLPMIEQEAFDKLLWSADFLIVRGEDSASRALLSGIPYLWTLYPQKENAHIKKMQAFQSTLVAAYPSELLTRRNRIEMALNCGKAPAASDLKAYFEGKEKFTEAALIYTKNCLNLPRAPQKIAQMLRDGLK